MTYTFEAYYAKQPTFSPNPALNRGNLPASHVLVKELEAGSPDEVFRLMQAEFWSPNGEAAPLIQAKGLGHTSMSVGDVIYDRAHDVFLEVLPIGFREF